MQLIQHEHTNKHLWLIELLAFWQGGVNATDIANEFKLTRIQARKYLARYTQQFPQQLCYRKPSKCFQPSDGFKLNLISGDVNQYLDWLTGYTQLNSMPSSSVTFSALHTPARQVSPLVMRGLVAALKAHKRLEVDYVSLSNPSNQGRIIQPHNFVKTGLRWHLRAYDEQSGEFRDFVLSRFSGQPDLLDQATHSQAQDQAWNTEISLVFTPDQRLSQAQQAVIEQDYQMQNGRLVVNIRAALAQYLIQQMQVNTKMIEADPTAQQIVLSNLSDIKQWLFNA